MFYHQDYNHLRAKLDLMMQVEPNDRKETQDQTAAYGKHRNQKKFNQKLEIPIADSRNSKSSNNNNPSNNKHYNTHTNDKSRCMWCGGQRHSKKECPAKDTICTI
eukprot:GHVR01044969.1.p2 GENE.GHVR01044969.1~~GHVR01044969.1.p2  ORF type:complete len:105 (+),score=28.03 GHVR01044969.1:366-680(+)